MKDRNLAEQAESLKLPSATSNTISEMFNYDEDYADKNGVDTNPNSVKAKKSLTIMIPLAALLLLVGFVACAPEEYAAIAVTAGLVILVASIICMCCIQKRIRNKYLALFTAFAQDGGTLWQVVIPKADRYNGTILTAAFEAVRDKNEVGKIIDKLGKKAQIKLPDTYPKPKVIGMNNVSAVDNGKKIKFEYSDLKGHKKSLKIINAFPGLVDFVNRAK